MKLIANIILNGEKLKAFFFFFKDWDEGNDIHFWKILFNIILEILARTNRKIKKGKQKEGKKRHSKLKGKSKIISVFR